jgi:hypothetical protein
MASFPSIVYASKPAAQITGAVLNANATVVNRSSTGTIRLGSDSSLNRTNGLTLGPLGSVQWTGGQLWAIVDPGTISDVAIEISTDAANPVSPVDIGVAIATELLASGIPSVFLLDTIQAGLTIGANVSVTLIDVAKYASLNIDFFNGFNSTVIMEFTDDAGSVISQDRISVTTTDNTPIQIPVCGTRLVITNISLNAITLNAYGSNRTISRLMMKAGSGARLFFASAALAAGAAVQLLSGDGSLGIEANSVQCDTTVNVNLIYTLAAPSVSLEIQVWMASAIRTIIPDLSNLTGRTAQQIPLPPGNSVLFLRNNTSSAMPLTNYTAIVTPIKLGT